MPEQLFNVRRIDAPAVQGPLAGACPGMSRRILQVATVPLALESSSEVREETRCEPSRQQGKLSLRSVLAVAFLAPPSPYHPLPFPSHEIEESD